MKQQPNNQSQAPNYSSQGASEAAAPRRSSRGAAAPIHMTIEEMKKRMEQLPPNCHEAIRLGAMIYVRRHEQMEMEVNIKPRVRVKAVYQRKPYVRNLT